MTKKFTLKPERGNLQASRPEAQELQTDAFIKGEEPKRSKTFMIPVSLHRQLRQRAFAEGRTDTAIIVQLLREYLSK